MSEEDEKPDASAFEPPEQVARDKEISSLQGGGFEKPGTVMRDYVIKGKPVPDKETERGA